jgi:hypothetical protein
MNAYLTIGGVPEYLKWVSKESSVLLSLCKNSFSSNAFFVREYERIFTSSLSQNKYYKEIIEILSKKKYATRNELAKVLGASSGGTLSNVLLDLEKSGFISVYHPFNTNENSLLTRFTIEDNYLQYYFRCIKPLQKNIESAASASPGEALAKSGVSELKNIKFPTLRGFPDACVGVPQSGAYDLNPKMALVMDSYIKWLGFSFERFCRKYHYVIARILQFAAVNYKSGAFFSRATEKESPGYQIDLIFDRADNVYTICEIKYFQGKVGTNVIQEFETKLSLFPKKNNKTIHKVLICVTAQ